MRPLAFLPLALTLVAPRTAHARPGIQGQSPAAPEACAVQGRVTHGDGRPMAGAAVALVRLGVAAVPEFQALTDAQGTFRMKVPAGTYALTATHREGLAAFLPKVKVEGAAATLPPVVLPAGGHLVEGRVDFPKGSTGKGVRLAFAKVSEDDGDVFPVPLRGGRFSLRLAEGAYQAFAQGAAIRSPRRITVPAAGPFHVAMEGAPSPAPQAVKAWIRSHAVPLKSAEAGNGFEDLRPLAKLVGQARVVSLGEATHGTREFFQMKHRMLEYLVSELGFTAFAIEANLPECQALNDYVLEGKGDPQKGLDGIYFWTWNTEEVLAMVEWMRRWNADPAHTRKVRFYGFDNQYAAVAYQKVKARLDQEDPDLAGWMGRELGALGVDGPAKPDAAKAKALREAAAELGRRLDAKAFDPFLRRCARILEQKLDIELDAQGGGVARDLGMAENVRWILDQEGPQGKIVLWAHNAHVQAGNDMGAHAWMGGHLRKALGKDMVVLGFAFREGSFQAIDFGPTKGGQREFTVKALPAATLDEALHAAGSPLLALDLRQVPPAGPVRAWFSTAQGTLWTGAGFRDGGEAGAISPTHVLEAYDGLLFVARTTAARPNHPRKASGAQPKIALLERPTNLGFEEGSGETPAGWKLNQGMKAYAVERVEGGAHEGRFWLQTRRLSDADSAPWGTAMQSLEAAPYRGKKVRLSGWLRASDGAKATYWLRVDRPGQAPGFFDNAMDRAVTQDAWTRLDIEGTVAPDAESLNFGAMVIGSGKAGFDDVRLEIVD